MVVLRLVVAAVLVKEVTTGPKVGAAVVVGVVAVVVVVVVVVVRSLSVGRGAELQEMLRSGPSSEPKKEGKGGWVNVSCPN